MVEGLEEQEVEVDDDAVVFRGASSRVSSAEVRDVARQLVALVLYRSEYNPYFKTNAKLFPALKFLVQLLQHLSEPRSHLVRRYGFYSSRSRGTWKDRPALKSRAPAAWYGREEGADPALSDAPKGQEIGVRSRRKALARLLVKVHELDVMACPRCGSRMSLIAVIADPAQIRKIIACLDRHGRGPPPLGRGSTPPRG